MAISRLENQLLDQAALGRHLYHLVESRPGLVVPRSYRGYPYFEAACRQFAAQGLPVRIRLSGGGLVPQGQGIINLHLAYPVHTDQPLQQAEQHYLFLCNLLAAALADIGIHATASPVQGSFCDGRFNLAVKGKKMAGTAQYWRRNPPAAGAPYSILSHAVLLADADIAAIHHAANAFEQAIGSRNRYRAETLTSAARCLDRNDTTILLMASLRTRLLDWGKCFQAA